MVDFLFKRVHELINDVYAVAFHHAFKKISSLPIHEVNKNEESEEQSSSENQTSEQHENDINIYIASQ